MVDRKTSPGDRRKAQAEATRLEIARAADELFRERGYVATTIEAIAARAGVAVQTIYNALGSKQGVLSAVLDTAAAGPQAPRTVPSFMEARSVRATSGREMIAVLADWFVEVHPRAATVFRIIRQAAAVDPGAAQLEQQRATQRLVNYRRAAERLRELESLRAGLSIDDAAALVWTLGHPETYLLLVEHQGWSIDRYRAWLMAGLCHALLSEPGEPR